MTSRSLLEYRDDVLALLQPLTPIDLSLTHAVGCVLVADVLARDAVPPLAIAAYDGFAVRAEDLAGASRRAVSLPVSHDVLPGAAPTRLARGAAARVSRGASIPFGADAVVARPLASTARVTFEAEPAAGDGIDVPGLHAERGSVVVPEGTRLGPGHIAALAAAGRASVLVRPAPRVVIVTVGSELVQTATSAHPSLAPDEPVRDASGALMSALVTAAGARLVRVVTVPDDARALRQAIDDAALQADLVLTLGGMSDDWRDVVVPVLTGAYGARRETVRLSPADAHVLGIVGDSDGRAVVLLGLPGHPVDAAAAFAGYVRHAILTLRGLDPQLPQAHAAVAWKSPFGYAQVAPVRRTERDGRAAVEPVAAGAAATLADLAAADGLAVVPESVTGVLQGDVVDVLWWQR